MKFQRQTREDVSVNLTPLIDVVFLLLIFFMVTTTFTKESHLEIDLPEASGKQVAEQPKQIEILINRQGNYAVNSQALVNNSIATIKNALQKVSNGDTSLPLVITADANTPYQAVVTAMDAAGQMGFVHLRVTTKQKAEESSP
ncbi:biopolymer transporter ExbD [Zooshikella marina]|uniref:Biopolymer transporter ExbD n=1 Tax=Zooshikella ganghwensis TaxID=202772 RepID=A0A4P9VPP4_9GAMM|nr:biopolymer transporter ExbD [Zooshikella ganghwensis]MBU2705215.1 biopolymer transporter ExbD [Zooshikella ganghwensis]RDH44344.1 biopolymer transporter ExbD [Zooshikella ganghwensis]